MRSANHEESALPTITIDDVTHNVADMRAGHHPAIRLLDRAPQRAILNHPSTVLFISHCGIRSTHETIFVGVPILGLPILDDQIASARKMAELQAGLWLFRSNTKVDTLSDALHRLLSSDSSLAKEVRKNMQDFNE
jgi:UDP:flavonoid glycosyltransferase YjiC (YdhE family)